MFNLNPRLKTKGTRRHTIALDRGSSFASLSLESDDVIEESESISSTSSSNSDKNNNSPTLKESKTLGVESSI